MENSNTAAELTQKNQNKKLNSNHIKLIAIIAMTIDHLTWTLCPGYRQEWWIILLHLIGRLTAPTMWFMICEGYHYTRDVKKYALRLFIFAIISHFAYNFCFGIPFVPLKTGFINQTSVMWSLAWAVTALYVLNDPRFKEKSTLLKVLFLFAVCVITFPSDWSCIAVLAIIFMNDSYGNLKKQIATIMIFVFFYAVVYFFNIDKLYAVLQLGVIIVWPFMANYNGQRGKWKGMKWFFYIYYPLHLFLLGLLRIYLY